MWLHKTPAGAQVKQEHLPICRGNTGNVGRSLTISQVQFSVKFRLEVFSSRHRRFPLYAAAIMHLEMSVQPGHKQVRMVLPLPSPPLALCFSPLSGSAYTSWPVPAPTHIDCFIQHSPWAELLNRSKDVGFLALRLLADLLFPSYNLSDKKGLLLPHFKKENLFF